MKRIISASVREDIPAFGSEKFFEDYRNGSVEIEDSFGRREVSLRPEDVWAFVFWTKNASEHFLQHLPELVEAGVPSLVQWTITAYATDIEPHVPAKTAVLEAFSKCSSIVGPSHCIWRYDPILISQKYTPEYHKRWFDVLAARLEGKTDRCVISFLDEYGKIMSLVRQGVMRKPTLAEVQDIAGHIAQSAAQHGMTVQTCGEGKYNLSHLGIVDGGCIDAGFIEQTFGLKLPADLKKQKSTRCRCTVNTDIGAYRRCKHDCIYCYAK